MLIMDLGKLIKKFFELFGYKIIRLKNIRAPKKIIVNDSQIEAKHFKWLERYNIKLIIDVGANEGQFVKKILTIFPNAYVHCFEPINSVFNQLKINLGHNDRVTLYNYGLGDRDGEVDIFVNEYSPSSSLLPMLDLHKSNFDFAVNVTPDKIRVRTLDSFFPNDILKPLLIKIDVQGYEMFVLKGGGAVIPQADVIIIETSFQLLYEGQPLFHDIYIYLTKMGFKYSGNVEQLLSPKDNSILQADAVFVRSTDM